MILSQCKQVGDCKFQRQPVTGQQKIETEPRSVSSNQIDATCCTQKLAN